MTDTPRTPEKTLSLRPIVANFAQAMERKLRTNDSKGRTGWRAYGDEYFMERLSQERDELLIALSARKRNRTSIRRECADLANFAMMVAYAAGDLKDD